MVVGTACCMGSKATKAINGNVRSLTWLHLQNIAIENVIGFHVYANHYF